MKSGSGIWLTELLMLLGGLLILGSVGAYSEFRTDGITFIATTAIGTVIILVGFIARKYITGRW